MHSLKTLVALAAFGVGFAAAESCNKDITVSDANPSISCDTVDGDITVKSSVAGDLVINGPKQIKGDLIIKNASQITSISSSTINSIGGTLNLDSLTFLSAINLGAVRSVESIHFNNLPRLNTLMFGSSGLTKASSIVVSDTFLNDMSQLNVAEADSFTIVNNKRLKKFNSDLRNITSELIVESNGQEMEIIMHSLVSAGEFQISDVKSLEVPLLKTMSKSLKFDTNRDMESFSAPNLTKTVDDVSFINNIALTNISLPKITSLAGLTILNNTKLEEIDGFPKLKTVNGGVILGGNFEKVELPSLDDVKGSVTVTSTTDIRSFCKFFDGLRGGAIQGEEKCTSKNANAESGGDGGQSSDGSSDSNDDSDSAADFNRVSLVVVGLAALASVTQLL